MLLFVEIVNYELNGDPFGIYTVFKANFL